jgi:autotransporter-associated beta strand protein
MKKAKPFTHITRSALGAAVLMLVGASAAGADYQSTVLGDGPLAYYPLDLNVDTGSTASDLSGNNNPGTLVNIASGFNNVSGPSAFITNGISFDGLSQYVDIGNGTPPALLNFGGAITMEAWVQPVSPNQTLGDILAKGYDPANTNDEIALRLNSSRYEGVTFSDSGGTQGAVGGTPTTNWTHVVATFDGSVWKIYVNGVLKGQAADTTGAINFPTGWRIGNGSASGAGRLFNGNISQVALYSYGLSSNQVLTHYFSGQYGLDPNTAVPVITAQPQSQSSFPGSTVTFSVSALSLSSTTNQWYKNNSPLLDRTNSTLILTNIQSGDVANYTVTIGNANGTTNSAVASLSLLASGNSLRWNDTANPGVWDTGASTNWINVANNQQVVFNTTDAVLFDDSPGVSTAVGVSGSVAPSVITVNSTNNNFTFNGSGQITGGGSLVKKGPSTLTLNVAGGFTGSATVSGGTLQTAGHNTLDSVSSIIVTNGGTLDLDAQVLTPNMPLTISGAGEGGEGVIFNSGNEVYDNVLNVTLAADAVFGSSSRWDLASGSAISGPHKLTLMRSSSGGYGEWNGVNIATNVGDIELAVGKLGIKNMSSNFGNSNSTLIVDNNFELDFWSGGCNRNIHVQTNGLVQILTALGPTDFNANVILEEGARWTAVFGSGDLPLNGTFTLNGVAHMVLGDANEIFNNVISGPGGFVWDGDNHQMIMQASNTYTGPTIIGQGLEVALSGEGSISHSSLIFFGGNDPNAVRIDVSGRSDQTLTLASGQTLGGIGSVGGTLTVSAGATLAPAGTNTTLGITTGANATGAISVFNDVNLSGTTVIKLNGSGTNDTIVSFGTINYGGTLNLVNISGAPLAALDSFQIFNAGAINGSFASITPASPGPGLAWDTNQLSSGILNVIAGPSQPVIGSTAISGGNFIFSGTNGPAGSNYVVLTSTNIAAPLSTWTPLATNTFDGTGTFQVTNALIANPSQHFFLIQLQ